MIAPWPGGPGRTGARTLGGHTAGQLLRLCEVAGLGPDDAESYAHTLVDALGPAAERPLDLPPPTLTYLSDDHTPVEFSLSFTQGEAPALRLLLEPGCGAGSLAENGRASLATVREMARRWDFSTERLDELADLFLPSAPHGPFALWLALELRPGGVPRAKVYLNPSASGERRATETVREALRRLGHEDAYATLPKGDGHPFLALDLGDWASPRVKVYVRHLGLSAEEAGGLSRMPAGTGPGPAEIAEFFRVASGYGDRDAYDDFGGAAGFGRLPLDRRPGLTCHALTEPGSGAASGGAAGGVGGAAGDWAGGAASGFTVHIPVRDYVRHDGEALDRAVALLRGHGMDPGPMVRALSAVTRRRPEDGTGLIAYLALAHQAGRPPRVTAYLSSEAYAVRPPAGERTRGVEAVH
ncbi:MULTISPECIES: tryptophan dimethylallyltransferase family protein [Streptomyces]|uniref:Tryptophan dimethylallyltransferase family protein n=1 Tax=Streptomyces solicathayae TaxID=3081768 RepID=A0ABZ0LS33_9ACTN|nr:tryptophan dimethylallyltransferase family protein [Streptomyces sp. HUAS YS2]WOX22293.1 tryptophan dimethylallyltransferase family protein [Streptomyces sp. HUAS YS2]